VSAVRGWLLTGAAAALLYAVLGLFLLERVDFVAGSVVAAGLLVWWGFLGWREDRRELLRRARDDEWHRRIREARQRGERLMWVVR
jgi:hypothetical protein